MTRFLFTNRQGTRIHHAAGRASVCITLGLSKDNVYSVSAKLNFFSRVLRRVKGRSNVSLAVHMGKSLRMSRRRAVRSATVTLKRYVGRTLNDGHKVRHCNCTLPVSSYLYRIYLSFNNHP